MSMQQALFTRKAIRIDRGQQSKFDDQVIEELPIATLSLLLVGTR